MREIARKCAGSCRPTAIAVSAAVCAVSQVTIFPHGLRVPEKIFAHGIWIGMIPFLWSLSSLRFWSALRWSFLFCCFYYAGCLYWITVAMSVYGEMPWIASFGVLFFLASLLSVFMAPAVPMGQYLASQWKVPNLLTIPTAWVAMEYVRTHVLTGFPWVNLADSQSLANLPLVQLASITGQNGVTWVLVMGNVWLSRFLSSESRRWEAWFVGVTLSVSLLWGLFCLYRPPKERAMAGELQVAALQGNIPQDQKWDEVYSRGIIQTYMELAREAAMQGAQLAVWPEAAFPFVLDHDLRRLPIADQFPIHQVVTAPMQSGEDFFNSAFLVDPTLVVRGIYDKTHLVPMGEYIPYKRVFFFVEKIVPVVGRFRPGTEIRPLRFTPDEETWDLGILLCYEDIFPAISRSARLAGAELLLNLTNDAWYQKTSGPYQHLAISIFRAIETRIPLIRVTNTGVTAAISPLGQIERQLPWFERGILYTTVPKPASGQSLYVRFGDWFPQGCVVAVFLAWVGQFVSRCKFRYDRTQ